MEAPVIKLARTPSRKISGTTIADKIRILVAPPGSTLGLQSENLLTFVRSIVTSLRLSDTVSLVVGGTEPAPSGYTLVGVLVYVGKAGMPGHATCFTCINNTWYFMDSDAGIKQTIKFSSSEFLELANSGRRLIEIAHPATGDIIMSDSVADRIRFFVRTSAPIEPSSELLSLFNDEPVIEPSNYSGNYIPSQSGATCVIDSVNNILFLADGIRGKVYNLLRRSGLDGRIRATPELDGEAFDAFVETELARPEWPTLVATSTEEEIKMLRVFILMALRMYDIEQKEHTRSNTNKVKEVFDFYLDRNPGIEMMVRSLQAISPHFRSLNVGDTSKVSDTDVRRTTALGDTLLHLGALYNIPAWIEPLVARGIDINGTNRMGFTALHFAVKQGHLEFVRELLRLRADLDLLNGFLFSPRRLAIEGNHLEILKLLDANGANTKRIIVPPYGPVPPVSYVRDLVENGRPELEPILTYLRTVSGGRRPIRTRRRKQRKNRSRRSDLTRINI